MWGSDETNHFGQRLQQARCKSGLTQKQAALLLGTSQSNISDYEHGIRVPSVERLKQIAILYKVSADKILGIKKAKILEIEDLPEAYQCLIAQIVKILTEKAMWEYEK